MTSQRRSSAEVVFTIIVFTLLAGVFAYLTWIVLVFSGILFLLGGIGASRQMFLVGIVLVALMVTGTWAFVAWGIRYIRRLQVASQRSESDSRLPLAIGCVALATVIGIATYIEIGLREERKADERTLAKYEVKGAVQIDSVSCRREDGDAVIEVSMSGGGGGAYRIQVDLFGSAPPVLIDRRERTMSLGGFANSGLAERIVYSRAELESLCVVRLAAAGRGSGLPESLEVVATLSRLKAGSSRVPTGETSIGRGRLAVQRSREKGNRS